MRKTLGAISVSFLMAVGGGAALAESNSGGQKPSTSAAAPSKASGTQTAGQQTAPVGFAEEEATSGPFTVESVNKKDRNLMLRAPDGTESTVAISAGTPGFDSLKKGDIVQLDYFAAAVFEGGQRTNAASQSGSGQNHASNQAGGTTSSTNGGQVRRIHKIGNSDNGHSGSTPETGNSGSKSGTNENNR